MEHKETSSNDNPCWVLAMQLLRNPFRKGGVFEEYMRSNSVRWGE